MFQKSKYLTYSTFVMRLKYV